MIEILTPRIREGLLINPQPRVEGIMEVRIHRDGKLQRRLFSKNVITNEGLAALSSQRVSLGARIQSLILLRKTVGDAPSASDTAATYVEPIIHPRFCNGKGEQPDRYQNSWLEGWTGNIKSLVGSSHAEDYSYSDTTYQWLVTTANAFPVERVSNLTGLPIVDWNGSWEGTLQSTESPPNMWQVYPPNGGESIGINGFAIAFNTLPIGTLPGVTVMSDCVAPEDPNPPNIILRGHPGGWILWGHGRFKDEQGAPIELDFSNPELVFEFRYTIRVHHVNHFVVQELAIKNGPTVEAVTRRFRAATTDFFPSETGLISTAVNSPDLYISAVHPELTATSIAGSANTTSATSVVYMAGSDRGWLTYRWGPSLANHSIQMIGHSGVGNNNKTTPNYATMLNPSIQKDNTQRYVLTVEHKWGGI